MSSRLNIPSVNIGEPIAVPSVVHTNAISSDFIWVDMLKGIAIIGVFLDNWTAYMTFSVTPHWLYLAAKTISLAVGPFVQIFFILSGFGLTTAYFNESKKKGWSWKSWGWRRVTKIILPYEIAVILSFLLGLIGAHLYESVNTRFSFASFLAHLLFLRNFHPPSWVWNPPLWFMPLIMGLYLSFPVLLRILERSGPWALIASSILVSYGTLILALFAGLYKGHQSDIFTFWIIQFSSGMVLAYIREKEPQKLNGLIGYKPFLIGFGFMMCSWGIRTYIPGGKIFNDSLTSIGIFLLLLNIVLISRAKIPMTSTTLAALSNESYFMYLIHYPIIQFLIGPPLKSPQNPILVMMLGCIYTASIFFLVRFFSPTVSRMTTWLYNKPRQSDTHITKQNVEG